MHFHSEVITTVKLIYIFSSSSYPFVIIKAPEIYSLSKSPVFNTILLMIVITLYIKSLDLFILYNCYFVPFGHFCVSPTSQLLVTFILFSTLYIQQFYISF